MARFQGEFVRAMLWHAGLYDIRLTQAQVRVLYLTVRAANATSPFIAIGNSEALRVPSQAPRVSPPPVPHSRADVSCHPHVVVSWLMIPRLLDFVKYNELIAGYWVHCRHA